MANDPGFPWVIPPLKYLFKWLGDPNAPGENWRHFLTELSFLLGDAKQSAKEQEREAAIDKIVKYYAHFEKGGKLDWLCIRAYPIERRTCRLGLAPDVFAFVQSLKCHDPARFQKAITKHKVPGAEKKSDFHLALITLIEECRVKDESLEFAIENVLVEIKSKYNLVLSHDYLRSLYYGLAKYTDLERRAWRGCLQDIRRLEDKDYEERCWATWLSP